MEAFPGGISEGTPVGIPAGIQKKSLWIPRSNLRRIFTKKSRKQLLQESRKGLLSRTAVETMEGTPRNETSERISKGALGGILEAVPERTP